MVKLMSGFIPILDQRSVVLEKKLTIASSFPAFSFSDAYIFGKAVQKKYLRLGIVYLLSNVFTIFLKSGFSTMCISLAMKYVTVSVNSVHPLPVLSYSFDL